jgi:cytochrome c-type biogenesis protein CcmH
MSRLLVLLLLVAPFSWSAIDAYEFRSSADEARFQQLTAELRCPKCQNQNIADSDSPIAKDLRREVYRMVDTGAPDTEVIDFMVTRYGDFVLYRPKVNSQTWFLWYGPYLLLGLGALIILFIVYTRKANRRAKPGGDNLALTSDERARLDELLNKDTKA